MALLDPVKVQDPRSKEELFSENSNEQETSKSVFLYRRKSEAEMQKIANERSNFVKGSGQDFLMENAETQLKMARDYFPLESTHQNKMLEKALQRLKMVKNSKGITEKYMRNPKKVIHFHIDAFEDKIEVNKFQPKVSKIEPEFNVFQNSTYQDINYG